MSGPRGPAAGVAAVVPVKRLDLAKGRLADLLTPAERRGLARAMLEDVLDALAATRALTHRFVVSDDPEVGALAADRDVERIADPGTGLNDAVRRGAGVAAERATDLLVVHGDLPLARAADFDALLAAHETGAGVTLAPDHADDGTNCLTLRSGAFAAPLQTFPFAFGRASFGAHVGAAGELGLTPTIVRRPGLARDVDRPEDVAAILAVDGPAAGAGRAVAFLRSSGIASRIADARAAAVPTKPTPAAGD